MMSKVVAFVPVRGGSKSVPFKNIKPLAGKPLVYWCLAALEKSNEVKEIYVATDSSKIAKVVKKFQFSKVKIYRRLKKNAQDSSSTESVMLEFLAKHKLLSDDLFVLVQATCPFTTAKNIDEALALYRSRKCDSILTCVHIKRFFWTADGHPINYDYRHRPLRQNFDGCYQENGAFYINKVKNILRDKNRLSGKIAIYEMPPESLTDIDDPLDWLIARRVLLHVRRSEKRL